MEPNDICERLSFERGRVRVREILVGITLVINKDGVRQLAIVVPHSRLVVVPSKIYEVVAQNGQRPIKVYDHKGNCFYGQLFIATSVESEEPVEYVTL